MTFDSDLPTTIALGQHFTLFPHEFSNGIKPLNLIWIPSGSFLMGQENKEVNCTLTQGFWISQYLVTNAHWSLIVDTLSPNEIDEPNYPVTGRNWYDALMCNWELMRFLRAGKQIPNGYRFTLPSTTQWEYSSKFDRDNHNLLDVGWFLENSSQTVHPVGRKLPNDFGLYDMVGNLNEWCIDSPSDLPNEDCLDWFGKGDGFVRSIRGGSYAASYHQVSRSFHDYMEPNSQISIVGFRICLSCLEHDMF